jgi:hypothetical protein
MNKKGIFFTLVVIAAISLFLVSYTFYKNYAERSTTQNRVGSLNTFLFSMEENLERQIFISGFRALFIMQIESLEQGAYIQNITSSLNELFFNGTFNNKEQPTMIGATFKEIQEEIQRNANKVNALVSLNNASINLNQSDPWNVNIIFKVNIYVQDKGNLVSWNKTQHTYNSKIPINGFEDPLYLLSTGGVASNKIIKTPFTTFTNGADITNLNNHTISGYYKESNKAPSYLNRLQGIKLADENGIESLVNIPKLSNQRIPTLDKSVIDYVYFSTNIPVSCKITGMPSWFKIDQSSLTDYQLVGLEHSCS